VQLRFEAFTMDFFKRLELRASQKFPYRHAPRILESAFEFINGVEPLRFDFRRGLRSAFRKKAPYFSSSSDFLLHSELSESFVVPLRSLDCPQCTPIEIWNVPIILRLVQEITKLEGWSQEDLKFLDDWREAKRESPTIESAEDRGSNRARPCLAAMVVSRLRSKTPYGSIDPKGRGRLVGRDFRTPLSSLSLNLIYPETAKMKTPRQAGHFHFVAGVGCRQKSAALRRGAFAPLLSLN
jgi:hypothetical protein